MPGTRRTLSVRAFLPLACLALLTASCTDPTRDVDATTELVTGAPGGPGQAPDVVIAVGSEPDTLNPVLGYARWGDGKVFEGLLQLGADLQPEPLLAQVGS